LTSVGVWCRLGREHKFRAAIQAHSAEVPQGSWRQPGDGLSEQPPSFRMEADSRVSPTGRQKEAAG